MTGQDPDPAADPVQLDALCSLGDPTRRLLYDFVVSRGRAVTRDEASQVLGLDRSTAAYHLDKLADEGLLTVSFARPPGRGGPGAGRPAKHYERAAREFTVNLPPRDYRLAAELLVRAVESDTTGEVRASLGRAAESLGRDLFTRDVDAPFDLFERLARGGYEPYADGDVIRLRNCPFHRLAREHTELVCGMNLTMLAAAAEHSGTNFEARLDPAEGRCCVAFAPARRARR